MPSRYLALAGNHGSVMHVLIIINIICNLYYYYTQIVIIVICNLYYCTRRYPTAGLAPFLLGMQLVSASSDS